MAYCRSCGSVLQDDAKFCPECGAPVTGIAGRTATAASGPEYREHAKRKSRNRKGLFRRPWFWILVVVIAVTVFNRQGSVKTPHVVLRPSVTATSSAPARRTTAQGTDVPTAVPTQEPVSSAVPENGIRPEVREFLEAYEACMDEYVAFMRKYTAADPVGILALMGDYTRILSRFSEYEEKMEAFDENDLNTAELALFLEVTNRVSQKLLTVAGG